MIGFIPLLTFSVCLEHFAYQYSRTADYLLSILWIAIPLLLWILPPFRDTNFGALFLLNYITDLLCSNIILIFLVLGLGTFGILYFVGYIGYSLVLYGVCFLASKRDAFVAFKLFVLLPMNWMNAFLLIDGFIYGIFN